MFDRPGIDATEIIGKRLALPPGPPAGVIHLDGPEFARLMRRHGVTMRDLKRKAGITLKTIRRYRADGVTGADVLAMFEFIVGRIPSRVEAQWMQYRRQQLEIV